jgi:hypothetical protein
MFVWFQAVCAQVSVWICRTRRFSHCHSHSSLTSVLANFARMSNCLLDHFNSRCDSYVNAVPFTRAGSEREVPMGEMLLSPAARSESPSTRATSSSRSPKRSGMDSDRAGSPTVLQRANSPKPVILPVFAARKIHQMGDVVK